MKALYLGTIIFISLLVLGCTPDYIKAHEHSSQHRAEISASINCGCFYCLKIYSSKKIEIWVDEDSSGVSQTAICPFCGIDAVIGDKSGYPISEKFLETMNKHWF